MAFTPLRRRRCLHCRAPLPAASRHIAQADFHFHSNPPLSPLPPATLLSIPSYRFRPFQFPPLAIISSYSTSAIPLRSTDLPASVPFNWPGRAGFIPAIPPLITIQQSRSSRPIPPPIAWPTASPGLARRFPASPGPHSLAPFRAPGLHRRAIAPHPLPQRQRTIITPGLRLPLIPRAPRSAPIFRADPARPFRHLFRASRPAFRRDHRFPQAPLPAPAPQAHTAPGAMMPRWPAPPPPISGFRACPAHQHPHPASTAIPTRPAFQTPHLCFRSHRPLPFPGIPLLRPPSPGRITRQLITRRRAIRVSLFATTIRLPARALLAITYFITG